MHAYWILTQLFSFFCLIFAFVANYVTNQMDTQIKGANKCFTLCGILPK